MDNAAADLSHGGHLTRNLIEDVEHLVAMGSSLEQALDHLGIRKNTYEKKVARE